MGALKITILSDPFMQRAFEEITSNLCFLKGTVQRRWNPKDQHHQCRNITENLSHGPVRMSQIQSCQPQTRTKLGVRIHQAKGSPGPNKSSRRNRWFPGVNHRGFLRGELPEQAYFFDLLRNCARMYATVSRTSASDRVGFPPLGGIANGFPGV